MSEFEPAVDKFRKPKKEKKELSLDERIKNIEKAIERDEYNMERNETAKARERVKIMTWKLAALARAQKAAA